MSHSPLQIRHSRVCIIQRLLHFSKDELNAHPVVSYYYMRRAKLVRNALAAPARSVPPSAAQAALFVVLVITQAYCTPRAHRPGPGTWLPGAQGVIAGLGEQWVCFPMQMSKAFQRNSCQRLLMTGNVTQAVKIQK